ncbi:MAG: DUF4332 domain-containing protein [Chloroflexi bacterium]|nr:DUF4332 domain-containing protein [Chloroflexota bacterium]
MTMETSDYVRYLKSRGKKAHVIQGLIAEVEQFEVELLREANRSLAEADEEDVRSYAARFDEARVREPMRALALYFEAAGRSPLARLASELREEGLARERKVFRLSGFRGLDSTATAQLTACGIVTVNDMLEAGRTPAARQALAQSTGLSPDFILECVKLSDLSRLDGIKGIRARLYYDAGIRTPSRLRRLGTGRSARHARRLRGTHRFRRHCATAHRNPQYDCESDATATGDSVRLTAPH